MRIKINLLGLTALIALITSACTAPTALPATIVPSKPETAVQDAGSWWQPEPGLSWQIQYTGEVDLSLNVDIYNLDLFETSAEEIEALHARGVLVICYLNAGAWEDWRPDSADFPEEVLGRDYTGWPGERWLDIRRMDALAPLITARLDLCAAKGFDGVDPDNLDGYTNATGFDLTADDQLAYNRWLAEAAHARGLGIGLKNDSDQAGELAAIFDWATVESCFNEGWYTQLAPFTETGKPIFAIEYTDNNIALTDFCDLAADLSIDALLKQRQLDGWREACP